MAVSEKTVRGDQTRQALLDAATEIFGRDGFHAASSRKIASAAGVNQALISYHFGGKLGLYHAVFELIAAHLTARIGPTAQSVQQQLAQARQRGEDLHPLALHALESVLFRFATMLGEQRTTAWARLILREQQDPTPAFDILYTGIMQRLLRLITELVAVLTNDAADAEAPALCALMLMGQVLVFRAARAAALRHMGWEDIGETEIEAIRDQLKLTLQARFAKETHA